MAARAGMVGAIAEIVVGLPDREIRVPLWTWGFVDGVGSLHVATPLCKSSDDELLGQAGAYPFRGSDCEISKDKANAAICSGKIKI